MSFKHNTKLLDTTRLESATINFRYDSQTDPSLGSSDVSCLVQTYLEILTDSFWNVYFSLFLTAQLALD